MLKLEAQAYSFNSYVTSSYSQSLMQIIWPFLVKATILSHLAY